MDDIPAGHDTPTCFFNFSTSAVDYIGPYIVKLFRLCRLQPVKVYVCSSVSAVVHTRGGY